MKKSIGLVVLLFSMAHAVPSRFVIEQMFDAIEATDCSSVKTLMVKCQFQKEPRLMERFLTCARDVADEQKEYISLTSSRFDLLTAVAGLGLWGVSAELGLSEIEELERASRYARAKARGRARKTRSEESEYRWESESDSSLESLRNSFAKHRKKIGAVVLLPIAFYLVKRGFYCEHAKKRVRFAQEIVHYLEQVQKGLVEIPAELAKEISVQELMKLLIAKVPLDHLKRV